MKAQELRELTALGFPEQQARVRPSQVLVVVVRPLVSRQERGARRLAQMQALIHSVPSVTLSVGPRAIRASLSLPGHIGALRSAWQLCTR